MQYTKFLVVMLLLIQSVHANGQDYNTWYFGQNAGLSFNTIPPTPLAGGQVNTPEGCASISNNAGNLLFYTDGLKVWDRNHNVMPNGTGLMGAASSTQSALIVPLPGVSSQYYIFTVTDWIGNGDLRYSIVDMSLNSGNGDIIAASKNTFLSTGQTEKLVSANSTNCGIWILTHQRNTDRFEAHLVTATGIDPPVFSNVGNVHNSTPTPPYTYNNLTGVMKVSKNSQKIGLATLGRIVQLFDFNPTTGQVSNPISLTIPEPKQGYGVCFSPDNSKFYINECYSSGGAGYDIFQYDITSSNSTTINNSKTFVGRATTPVIIIGEMQIGPDNKIYFTKAGTNFLGLIPNPNLAAPACGFINNGISLAAGISQSGLPNDIRKGGLNTTVNLGNDTTLCPGANLTLTAPSAPSYLWSTGATTQSISVTLSGQYWVTISNGACSNADTINVLFAAPSVNLGNDTTLCTGQSLTLNAGSANSYLWSTGATSQTISINTPGQYWVNASNGTCFDADTINVSFAPVPVIFLGNDSTLCTGQSITLNAGSAASYLWSTGATSQTIIVTTAGQYWVRISNGTCFNADTINIAFNTPPIVNLGNDTTLCTTQSIILNAGAAGSYLWSTGATSQTIPVNTPGQYWVRASNGNCFNSDTINVSFAPVPAIFLGNDSTVCTGQTITLNAGAAASYLWSTGATSQTIIVTTAGQYWVRISNGTCFNADTINIAFNTPPIVNLGNDTTLCTQSIILNAGAAGSYLWSTGATSQTISVNMPGQYWVRVSNGNCSNSDTINVSFAAVPTIFLGNDSTLCTGQSITLNAGSAAGYLWSTGATSQTINVNTPGQYWVRISNGTCFNADTINIAFNTPPIVNLGIDTTLCIGQSLTLNAGAAGSYLWSTGATSQTISVNTPGQYWVNASNGNCPNSDTINVSFAPVPVIFLGNDSTLCTGQSITLNAGSAAGYLWSTGATSQTIVVATAGQYWVSISNGTCFNADTINVAFNAPPIVNLGIDTTLCTGQSLTLNAGAAGSYLWSTGATSQNINISLAGQYWVRASNGNCINTDTINILYAPPPVVDLGKDSTLCQGQNITLTSGNANSYLWSTGQTLQTINVMASGQYWVKASNAGCSRSDTIEIIFKVPPPSPFPVNISTCSNQLLILDAGDANKYLWSTGESTRTIKVVQEGNYRVTVNYFNSCQTQYATLVKYNNCACELYVPNAFTPDNNGKNDLFKPARRSGCQFLKFAVYNRWGQKVFETSDLDIGWDGKYSGKDQPSGIYVWQIFALVHGKQELFNGTAMLIR